MDAFQLKPKQIYLFLEENNKINVRNAYSKGLNINHYFKISKDYFKNHPRYDETYIILQCKDLDFIQS